MKKAIFATMFLAATSLFAGPRIAIGVGIGVPAPVAVVRPACPGPGYNWVDGYWANGVWVAGYWAPPVAVRVAPRYYAPRVVVPERHFDHRDFRGDFHRDFRR